MGTVGRTANGSHRNSWSNLASASWQKCGHPHFENDGRDHAPKRDLACRNPPMGLRLQCTLHSTCCSGALMRFAREGETKLSYVRLWMSGYGCRLGRQGSLVRTLAWPTPTMAPAQHQPPRGRTASGTGMVAPARPAQPTLGQPACVRATGYCRAMAQCSLQNYSARHGARYSSGSWVCNSMS